MRGGGGLIGNTDFSVHDALCIWLKFGKVFEHTVQFILPLFIVEMPVSIQGQRFQKHLN